MSVFHQLCSLYYEVLRLDQEDVEANFNLAMLHLQSNPQGQPDFSQSLKFFLQAVQKDNNEEHTPEEVKSIYRPQFAKAYYNIGMIYDRLGDVARASAFYKKAIDKCEEQPQQENEDSVLTHQHYYVKAVTNYAVTLEKLGRREEALRLLEGKQKREFGQEIRVFNNLGIIHKRNGNAADAEASYLAALQIDSESFFPNYNMGVLKASTREYDEAMRYFQKSLELARANQDEVYQINTHINMALVLERIGDLVGALSNIHLAQNLDPLNQKIKDKTQQLVEALAKEQNKIGRKSGQSSSNAYFGGGSSSKGNGNANPASESDFMTEQYHMASGIFYEDGHHNNKRQRSQTKKNSSSASPQPPLLSTSSQQYQTSQNVQSKRPSVGSSFNPEHLNMLSQPKKDYSKREDAEMSKKGMLSGQSSQALSLGGNNSSKKFISKNMLPDMRSSTAQSRHSTAKQRTQIESVIKAIDHAGILDESQLPQKSVTKVANDKAVLQKKSVKDQQKGSVLKEEAKKEDVEEAKSAKEINEELERHETEKLIKVETNYENRYHDIKETSLNNNLHDSVDDTSNLLDDIKVPNLKQEGKAFTTSQPGANASCPDAQILFQDDSNNLMDRQFPTQESPKRSDMNKLEPTGGIAIESKNTFTSETAFVQKPPQSQEEIKRDHQDQQHSSIYREGGTSISGSQNSNETKNQIHKNKVKTKKNHHQEANIHVQGHDQHDAHHKSSSLKSDSSLPQELPKKEPPLIQVEAASKESKERHTMGPTTTECEPTYRTYDDEVDEDDEDDYESGEQSRETVTISGKPLETNQSFGAQKSEETKFSKEQAQKQIDQLPKKETSSDFQISEPNIVPKKVNANVKKVIATESSSESHIICTDQSDNQESKTAGAPKILINNQDPSALRHISADVPAVNLDEVFDTWTEQECLRRLGKNKKDIHALYRMANIQMADIKRIEEALKNLLAIDDIDKTFMQFQRYMKVGECFYKEDRCEQALTYFDKAQPATSSDEDVCIVEFARGKCLDRLKRFQEAVAAYQSALIVAMGHTSLYQQANLHFRLGWVYIRSRLSIEQGISHLRKANSILNNSGQQILKGDQTSQASLRNLHQEIMSKLAHVLFKEFCQGLTSAPTSVNNSKNGPLQDVFTPQIATVMDECLDLAKKSLQINPKDSDLYQLTAKIQDRQGLHTEAIESYNNALKLQANQNTNSGPLKANIFFHLGCIYEKTKEPKKAILNYKKCLTLDSRHFGACIHLANLLANVGEGQRAAKYFRHAIKIAEENASGIGKEGLVNAYFGLGKTLQQYSDNKDAPIEPLEKVRELDPKHYKTLTQLGILYLDREEYEIAADYLKQALTLNRGFPLALVSMGNLLFETGHSDEAIRYHKQALSVNDKELQALIGLGNAYYDSQRPQEAVDYYRKALQLDQQLADVHYNLGNALYLIEDIGGAIEHYRLAIGLNPKKAESHYNLGNALCVKNDYPAAIAAYQVALEIDPRNAPALYNLGNAYYMVNRFEEAVRVYLKALDINERSAECHFNLASAYNDLGEHQQALSHYQRSIELDEANVDAYICLGGVLENMKAASEKAERYYRQALERDPGNPRALEALKKLKHNPPGSKAPSHKLEQR